MKKAIIIFILVLLPSLAFAQSERNGTIIGTFGLGIGSITTVETEVKVSLAFDLNLISRTGFTLCFTDIIGVGGGGFSQNILFGAGYNFLRDKWYIGGALLFSPTAMDLIIAGKINGGYFFTDDIGITGILMYRQTTGISWDLSMFDVFVGVSVRLF
jgi:hypothetical protein